MARSLGSDPGGMTVADGLDLAAWLEAAAAKAPIGPAGPMGPTVPSILEVFPDA